MAQTVLEMPTLIFTASFMAKSIAHLCGRLALSILQKSVLKGEKQGRKWLS
jgi:hypothetical protein